ncbi:MAG: hypothetical protein RM049_23465 [Nostoc sp. DedQUE04]|uniref:hypothetical protein n=1 Tax=Nostoc sp. DedQUE04 TaxID=3075390 RepID=UPI002AD34A0C|nr:hypothetical protein [Nostoc sp. DedQUE04]MDZ8138229.1 hypothetical protein [Nostoc sp. DedQUE04]
MHQLYTVEQLQAKSLFELKVIYTQIGADVQVADKRYKRLWANVLTYLLEV